MLCEPLLAAPVPPAYIAASERPVAVSLTVRLQIADGCCFRCGCREALSRSRWLEQIARLSDRELRLFA